MPSVQRTDTGMGRSASMAPAGSRWSSRFADQHGGRRAAGRGGDAWCRWRGRAGSRPRLVAAAKTRIIAGRLWWCGPGSCGRCRWSAWRWRAGFPDLVLHALEPVLGDPCEDGDGSGGEVGHGAFEAGPGALGWVEFWRNCAVGRRVASGGRRSARASSRTCAWAADPDQLDRPAELPMGGIQNVRDVILSKTPLVRHRVPCGA